MQLDLKLGAAAPVSKQNSQPQVYTVRELTTKIRRLLENSIGQVWVRGEISNHRKQSSGHQYFSIKDETSQLSCVLFAGDAKAVRGVELRDGVEVQLAGELTVYESRGQYQMVVRHVQAVGAGLLQVRLEALKRKLDAEGLFASERKRSIPRFPACIGLVTSPTGAAFRDFLKVLWRRNPGIRVIFYPVRVQGSGAAAEIAGAIKDLNRISEEGIAPVELLVVTRGGGSIEDLWEFNEEETVRAVAASGLPVVNAVGHEIDFTLCDFAADLRAPTPSAGAELIAVDAAALLARTMETGRRMAGICRNSTVRKIELLRRMVRGGILRGPGRALREKQQDLDRRAEMIQELTRRRIDLLQQKATRGGELLRAHHPARWLKQRECTLEEFTRRIIVAATSALERDRRRLGSSMQLLRAFDPSSTLARGFTMTLDAEGKLLTSARQAGKAGTLVTRFSDGEVRSIPTHSPKAE